MANMNAIRSVLPNAQIKGCLFHFSQSIWRRISSSGQTSSYRELGNSTRSCAFMLFGLPFVPVEDVEEKFDFISEQQADVNLDDLIDYVEGTHRHTSFYRASL
ncbi:hypothetical protein M514_13011 [Trichuris suis]|uniref:MULE transposase domain-containing protein n=1 Tax=Trichuris suis TaxID=68888 RepID=A0A085LMC0_9BILA|nr:hypothetical protein M513_13011 [Trichuris suis]KFD59818.1 hypothetical protein M514_13011 [Trichuris suis]